MYGISASCNASNGRKPRAGDYLSGVSRSAFRRLGHQVEENKHNALEKYKGQYVLVVDGSIPLKDNGIYCMVAGEPIVDHIRKAAEGAAAIIAIGSCSAWGGVAAAGVNPTGAVSLQEVLPGKTVINIPGCRRTRTTSSRPLRTSSLTANRRNWMTKIVRPSPMAV